MTLSVWCILSHFSYDVEARTVQSSSHRMEMWLRPRETLPRCPTARPDEQSKCNRAHRSDISAEPEASSPKAHSRVSGHPEIREHAFNPKSLVRQSRTYMGIVFLDADVRCRSQAPNHLCSVYFQGNAGDHLAAAAPLAPVLTGIQKLDRAIDQVISLMACDTTSAVYDDLLVEMFALRSLVADPTGR